jgi:hypothetical protein
MNLQFGAPSTASARIDGMMVWRRDDARRSGSGLEDFVRFISNGDGTVVKQNGRWFPSARL